MLSTTSALLSLHYAGARSLLHLPRSACRRARLHRKAIKAREYLGLKFHSACFESHNVAFRLSTHSACHLIRCGFCMRSRQASRRECLRSLQSGGPASSGLIHHRTISQEGLSCFQEEWPVRSQAKQRTLNVLLPVVDLFICADAARKSRDSAHAISS